MGKCSLSSPLVRAVGTEQHPLPNELLESTTFERPHLHSLMQEFNDPVVVLGVEGEHIAEEVVAKDEQLATPRLKPGERGFLVTPDGLVDAVLALAYRARTDFAQLREIVLRNSR